MVPRVDVAIIGGGVVGLYTALDLSLRDFIGSGTSRRMHGLLHSGARYAV